MRRRGRFADVISRQLDLFEREEADLIRESTEAERRYERAPTISDRAPGSAVAGSVARPGSP